MRSDCPISYALDFFGDKWTLLIVRDMVFFKKKFYKDFLDSKEGVATNILSDRLKKLESNGIVTSSVYESLKTRKEYVLTSKGKELIPMLVDMMVWSSKYKDGLDIPDGFVSKVTSNREEVISKLVAELD